MNKSVLLQHICFWSDKLNHNLIVLVETLNVCDTSAREVFKTPYFVFISRINIAISTSYVVIDIPIAHIVS